MFTTQLEACLVAIANKHSSNSMVAIRTTVMQAKMGIVTFKEFINTLKELADRVKVPARTIKSLIELIIMELKLLASIRLIMVLDSNSILTLAIMVVAILQAHHQTDLQFKLQV